MTRSSGSWAETSAKLSPGTGGSPRVPSVPSYRSHTPTHTRRTWADRNASCVSLSPARRTDQASSLCGPAQGRMQQGRQHTPTRAAVRLGCHGITNPRSPSSAPRKALFPPRGEDRSLRHSTPRSRLREKRGGTGGKRRSAQTYIERSGVRPKKHHGSTGRPKLMQGRRRR
jgi:hypothetical protein